VSFKNIKGQNRAIDFLKSSITNGKVSHAYLFTGPSGIGRKLTAVNFAKALNCPDIKDGESCDICSQCKKIDSSNHPDVLISSPAREDSSFGIDKVRSITRDAGLRPYEGRKKVYILDSADSMTQEAQNALLKTLEEPPSDSVLILIADDVNAMFPTIQSRAKRVRFFPLASEDIRDLLMNNYKVDRERADILSRISSGMFGEAIKYNDEALFSKRNRIIDGVRSGAILDGDFDNLSKSDLRIALNVMLTWYRDILIVKAGADTASAVVNIDKLEPIRFEAKRSSFSVLNNIINQIILTRSFLEQNINPKLAMGVLGINIMRR
jgi:DNA polymerase-3 subunit delta'